MQPTPQLRLRQRWKTPVPLGDTAQGPQPSQCSLKPRTHTDPHRPPQKMFPLHEWSPFWKEAVRRQVLCSDILGAEGSAQKFLTSPKLWGLVWLRGSLSPAPKQTHSSVPNIIQPMQKTLNKYFCFKVELKFQK